MSAQYARDHVKISVAKILQTLGWHSINTTPLEVLTDILGNYITQIGKLTNEYATEFGHTEPNLDHLGLAFRDMNVNLVELDEYVTNVNFAPPAAPVPKFPLQKENNLNFLKPGSKEVVTRPVHIHEHLPPMYPLLEGSEAELEIKQEEPDGEAVNSSDNGQVFKKPADVSPMEFKRSRKEEEGSRPTREISSVMMTTSGFLSPAREGKLPEARSPIPPVVEQPPPPPPPPAPVAATTPTAPEVTEPPPPPDQPMNLVKTKKHEKKKDKVHKELFKTDEKPSKKSGGAKEVKKHQKANGEAKPKKEKINKTLAAARMKTEKLNTTITPIPSKADCVGKLFNEPDKKKVNILKKISNVKNEKHEGKNRKDEPMSHGSSPDLVIDEPDDIVNRINLPNDITIEPIPPPGSNYYKSPDKPENPYFDSPPGTPSTPKTPELISSPPQPKEKRKRKESKRVSKKVQKLQHAMDSEPIDVDMERPKTPEVLGLKDAKQLMANMPNMPFPFLPSFGGIPPLWPGLIPPPMPNPLFPFNPLSNLAKNQFMPVPGLPNPLIPNFMPLPAHQPPFFTSPKEEKESRQKSREPPAVEITPIPAPPTPKIEEPQPSTSGKPEKKSKEHKKEKKDKKKNKKDKLNKAEKAEKKKLKEEKKEKTKKEKKERKKTKEQKEEIPKLLLKFNNPNGRPDTPDSVRKVTVKPVVKKNEEVEADNEKESLAKISALYTGPPKTSKSQPSNTALFDNYSQPSCSDSKLKKLYKPIPKIRPKESRREVPVEVKVKTPSRYFDEDGKEVWICPGCEKQDDGSPMIGCDGCDAWYHWVCVGIQVPPDENENWYCRYCLLKKNEGIQSDKKKKRKKREKKEH